MTATARIRYDGDVIETRALPTPLPGIVLTHVPDEDPEVAYSLTHARSGAAICFGPSPELLAQFIPMLPACDWTRSGADLNGDPDIKAAIKDLGRRHPGNFLMNRGSCRDDLDAES